MIHDCDLLGLLFRFLFMIDFVNKAEIANRESQIFTIFGFYAHCLRALWFVLGGLCFGVW